MWQYQSKLWKLHICCKHNKTMERKGSMCPVFETLREVRWCVDFVAKTSKFLKEDHTFWVEARYSNQEENMKIGHLVYAYISKSFVWEVGCKRATYANRNYWYSRQCKLIFRKGTFKSERNGFATCNHTRAQRIVAQHNWFLTCYSASSQLFPKSIRWICRV